MQSEFTLPTPMIFRLRVNRLFDGLLDGYSSSVGRFLPAYQFWLLVGVLSGIALGTVLARQLELSVWVIGLMAAASLITSLGLALAVVSITGRERLTNYHHQIIAVCASGVVLALLNQPVRVYLDLLVLGFGMIVVFGRLGCLQAGCCHGRPHECGVRYHHATSHHVLHRYGHTRLFPVQALESAWALLVVLGGVFLILAGNPPGSALSWYVLLYAAGRFAIEYLRGDTGRPYYRGLSEPQWTSLALLALVSVTGVLGLLPLHVGYPLALALVAAAMLAARALDPLKPRDLVDLVGCITLAASVAEAHTRLGGSGETIAVLRTEQGLRVSAGMLAGTEDSVLQFTISHTTGRLAARDIRRVSALVRHYHPGEQTLIPGNHGVTHLLVRGV